MSQVVKHLPIKGEEAMSLNTTTKVKEQKEREIMKNIRD
jgi:hypothetical protein